MSYPQTDVFLIAFSLVDPVSLGNVETKWYPEVTHHCPNTPIILVGTKLDLIENLEVVQKLKLENKFPVPYEQAVLMKRMIDARNYLECSALTVVGLSNVFSEVLKVFLSGQPTKHKKSGGGCLLL
uniref:Uncharacterized protein n=1 Tax=Arcella intermedia TaxID=1963864 RepID=A0A6B2LR72_9EUKA